MKIKDILKLSAKMLENQNAVEYLENGASLLDDDGAKREVDLLLRCLNIVLSELAVYYSAFIKSEKITTANGIISYESLSENILETVKVYDEYGNELKYTNNYDYLKTKPDKVIINYSYLPKNFTVIDEVQLSNKKLTESVIAKGVVGEYILISGDYQKGAIWLETYNQALKNVFLKKSFMTKARCLYD